MVNAYSDLPPFIAALFECHGFMDNEIDNLPRIRWMIKWNLEFEVLSFTQNGNVCENHLIMDHFMGKNGDIMAIPWIFLLEICIDVWRYPIVTWMG